MFAIYPFKNKWIRPPNVKIPKKNKIIGKIPVNIEKLLHKKVSMNLYFEAFK